MLVGRNWLKRSAASSVRRQASRRRDATGHRESLYRRRLVAFPEKLRDLETECSCPDWSNPCKHIAAVYYLLGEEFDRDPFLLFKLRGRSREDVIALLGKPARAATAPEETSKTSGLGCRAVVRRLVLVLEWVRTCRDVLGTAELPPVTAVLPRRSAIYPSGGANVRCWITLTPIYAQAALRGMDVFLGEKLAE